MKTKFLLALIIFLAGMQFHCVAQFQAGDSLKFWSPSYIDWPPLWGAAQREIPAVCKKAGNHCYVFAEVTGPQPTQSMINQLVQTFDNQFYAALTSKYGPVPDVFDGDSNIFIVFLDENNWCGYFDPGQQMKDSMVFATWNKHGSEREIIFVASQCYQGAEEIVAHEFGHLLHWQQDHSPEPVVNPTHYWEEAWVDEGFSTFAAIYLTENIFQHNVPDDYTFFTSDPDIPLIYFSDYNQVKLFMLFMFEHFGNWNYISTLISNQLNGIPGVDSTLDSLGYTQTFDDAFEQWVIANYADDSVYEGGKYSYSHYSFQPAHISAQYNSVPANTVNATVNPYGADYIVFSASSPKTLTLTFDGQQNSKFRLAMILKNSSAAGIDSVIRVSPDSQNHATFVTTGLGSSYDQVVMAVMNIDSTIHEGSSATYSYSAAETSGIPENTDRFITVFPNPASDQLFISSQSKQQTKLELYNVRGQLCYYGRIMGFGIIDLRNLTDGVYFLKAISNEKTITKKITKY